ncbi:MAG TPA: hypothetical protein ENK83_08290 [Aliiroseovarius sp.]|nr:hypothetical protein [Aliiroseovarius sp.]
MRILLFCVATLFCLTTPASAEPILWRVSLAGLSLGQLRFEMGASGPSLRSDIANTPMGVFNGSFTASTRRDADGSLHYVSASRTTRKSRDISFTISAAGQVQDVRVTPAGQRTPLSVAEKGPVGVIDPTRAFARLVTPSGCPAGFALYDGRRVVQLSQTGQRQRAGRLVCQMRYSVTAGPAHLSPLSLHKLSLEIEYTRDATGALQLDRLKMRGGVFTLRLARQ